MERRSGCSSATSPSSSPGSPWSMSALPPPSAPPCGPPKTRQGSSPPSPKEGRPPAPLLAALPAGTFLMHGTLGRGQSKATIEGSFGLFAQDLGSVTAVVDVASPQRIALSVADAVTRAYAAGRNRRPRRKDGKTPCELYLTADPSSEQVAAAIAKIRAIKDRIDRGDESEAARHDPAVRATIEDAFTRFGFTEDGNVMASLATLPLAAVQAAVAIYAAKRSTGSLPAGAGLRYFAGIARHCQHQRGLP